MQFLCVCQNRNAMSVLPLLMTIMLVVIVAASCSPARETGAPAVPTLIINARVIDGTGSPARPANVRIAEGKIVEVGDLDPAGGEEIVDAGGSVLAPGFIDTHSHADGDLFTHPDALAVVSQGITTVIGGQDGGSPYPLSDFIERFRKEPAAVNVALYSGHGTLREQVMGEDFRREATPEEVEKMRGLLKADLDAGALGLSTGLEYDPGIYSATGEVLALARDTAAEGGRYISHVRSEDRWFSKAIEEIIEIGRTVDIPVQISHIKLAMRSNWGNADKLVQRLDRARAEGVHVTADIYPYLYWQSTLTVLFPERDFEDREEAEFVLREIAAPDGLLMGYFRPEPSYAGMTIADISALRGTDPATTLMDMIRESLKMREETGKSAESVIGTSMSEPDVERLMAWPHTNFCTDGGLDGRHPRGFGSYPRILGRYVRERGVLPIEEAIRKMTGLAAQNTGISDRGVIRPGAAADLVLFNPDTIIDRATPKDPQAVSVGVDRVWVNGRVVFTNGHATEDRPGVVITRENGGNPSAG